MDCLLDWRIVILFTVFRDLAGSFTQFTELEAVRALFLPFDTGSSVSFNDYSCVR
jgi:hypothetical protein